MSRRLTLVATAALAVAGCDRSTDPPPLLELLPPEATGVDFVNELPEDPEFTILDYLYYYNGGGVAVGDVDNDDLPDLYFTSNLGPNRLYRNRGNYQFEDITEQAGVAGPDGWSSGATMADVNGDGHTDVYVSGVSYLSLDGRNVLYINNGGGTFRDETAAYGLEHVGYSTQSLFFDYDGDGRLDMYLLNHSTHGDLAISASPQREVRHPKAGDRLFRNDGDRFVDVSEEAGIWGGAEGYGLGVVASDLDLNGCPDLYIANDFQENDFLYYNNCDGTFSEEIATATGHTSLFSMGADAADFNNDGRPDLIVVDMLPEREEILKTAERAESYDIHNMKVRAGYHPQYARNTLHLNRGHGRFSDIGYLAGVHATDWSWAPLFVDLDNDGHKDLFITNGIYRRLNDLDYINYISDEAIQATLEDGGPEAIRAALERMPQVPIANYAYRNNGDLTFTDMAEPWGLAQPGFSNGAAYVDLNNSGALDLVVNNINAPASIYRNRSREVNEHHYLKVDLRGPAANTAGIGAKVIVEHGETTQTLEQLPTRGYQSSVDPRLHFGLGRSARIDSLTVVWPDQRYQVLTNVPADQTVTLTHADAEPRPETDAPAQATLFEDVTARLGLDFRHEENTFFDYGREPFMPHQRSIEGPALAVGDLTGNGLDDIYVGGAKWQAGRLLVQQADGRFVSRSELALSADSTAEDVDAAFFDADGDGHLDLYVVSGGNEFWGENEALRDRLYLNDGQGNLRRAADHLPDIFENGCCVATGDFNGDDHTDLFVGSRVVARGYGLTPRSVLLENDGTGRFVDVTGEKGEPLSNAGMVSSAAWLDYDRDTQLDLVVAGEWMPVRLFRQEDGRFVDRTAAAGLSGTNGWWNAVSTADLTGDGHEDLVLGNLGLNSYIRASAERPARLYVHDFAGNGVLEQILTFYKDDVSYPLVGRDELVRHIPYLRSKYTSYAEFGASRIEDIFPAAELEEARVHEAYDFASAVAVNNGDATFTVMPLPTEAQFAPIYAALAEELDGDEHADLLVAGNFYGVTPVRGRYDASYGLFLRGDGQGGFETVDMQASGVFIDGQVRDMQLLRHADGDQLIVVARNDDMLQILRPLHE